VPENIRNVMIVVPPLVFSEGHIVPGDKLYELETRRLISPVEPASVAANLIARGFAARIFDLGVHFERRFESLKEHIEDFKPDAVVMVQSILTFVTAQDWDGQQVFDMARELNPKAITILTGNTATNYPAKAVGEKVCDYSIKGEVDFAIGDLFVALNKGADISQVAGVCFCKEDGSVFESDKYPEVDISTLPIPAFDVLDEESREKYTKILERGKIRFPERSTNYRDIIASRSCVLRCSFCSVAHLRGPRQKYRRKKLDQVLDEIETALNEGIKEIHFFDELFANEESEILDFTNGLKRRNLKFPWMVAQGQSLWALTPDSLRAMAETGMYRLIAPFESGSDRVLKEVVGKVHSTVEHHHNVALLVRKLDLELIALFVVGMVGETRQEILETLDFAESHPEIDYSVFSIAFPLVGTKLMRNLVKSGKLGDPDKINRVVKRTVGLCEQDEFAPYELGVLRAYDWDRVNFSSQAKKEKYIRMVGITMDELDALIAHSKQKFHSYFPDYDGPLSFRDLVEQQDLFLSMEAVIPESSKIY
jgi:anaerobic magnesium-protoporphyrin IX monomethyl ester cyclase